MSEGHKLFKFYLDSYEKHHNTRPEFLYRINRNKFQTMIMKPVSWFAPWYSSQGWIMKGALLYFVYYWTFKKQPYTKHWNREGYVYEEEHKTPNKQM
jgi:hypothetical protein